MKYAAQKEVFVAAVLPASISKHHIHSQPELGGCFTTCLQSRAWKTLSGSFAATSEQAAPPPLSLLSNKHYSVFDWVHFFLRASPSHVLGANPISWLNSWHWPVPILCLSKILGRSTQLQSSLNGRRDNKYSKWLIWFSRESIWGQELFPICVTAITLPTHLHPP